MTQALIARQPIVDGDVEVRAYELLFRSQAAPAADGFDGDMATATVVVNTLLELGLDAVAGDHEVYINVTRPFLEGGLYTALPPERVVLEVLEDIVPDAGLRSALTAARDAGYRIALDDYVPDDPRAVLLDLADVIKVETIQLDDAELVRQARLLRRPGVELLAEKVETRQRFDLAREAGYGLFQGWFYAKPHLLSRQAAHAERVSLMRILASLADPDIGVEEVGGLVEQNAVLSYKLMRFVNSAALSLSREIQSVRHACVMLGLERVRVCVTLLLLAEVGDKPHQLLEQALYRGRMCELLAALSVPGEAPKFFTVGLFSLLDAFFDRTEEELLGEVPLAAGVRAAILEGAGEPGLALRTAVACERAEWQALDRVPYRMDDVADALADAIAWSQRTGRMLGTMDSGGA